MPAQYPKALTAAQTLTISSSEDYETAGQLKVACREARKTITAWFRGTEAQPGPLTLAFKSWKVLTSRETDALKAYEAADGVLERKMVVWNRAQAEKAQQALQAEVAEARRKAIEETLAHAVALEAEAQRVNSPALQHMADRVLDQPIDVAPAGVTYTPPKVAGITGRKQLTIEVTDKKALVLQIAAGYMVDLVAQQCTGQRFDDRQLVLQKFLGQFVPIHDGLEFLDVNVSHIRTVAGMRAGFTLAGVTIEQKDRVI